MLMGKRNFVTVQISNENTQVQIHKPELSGDKEIWKMLQYTTDTRNKALILFLSASGARVGALHDLNYGDIKPIEDGAIVWIYNEDMERYRTFLTPEAYQSLKDYFEFRALKGYPVVSKDQPVFCKRDYHTRVTYHGSREILTKLQQRAGLRGKRAENKVSSKAPNHGFRKRFELTLVSAEIHSKTIEALCGSIETGRDNHYFKNTITDENLWRAYRKAIPLLTVNQENRLKYENENQKVLIDKYENEYNKRLEEFENVWIKVYDNLKMEFTIEKMKNKFRDDLDGRGLFHNEIQRNTIRDFISKESAVEVLESYWKDKDFVKQFKETEPLYRKNKK